MLAIVLQNDHLEQAVSVMSAQDVLKSVYIFSWYYQSSLPSAYDGSRFTSRFPAG